MTLPPWIQGRFPVDAISTDALFTTTAVGRSFAEEPLGFVDIGARGGVHDLVAPIASCAAVLGFEPDEPACAELNALLARQKIWAQAKCLPIALSDAAGPATLHLCAAPTNHSLLPVNQSFIDRYRMEKFTQTGSFELQTKPLDAVLFDTLAGEQNWGEFIKIDTQGTEFEILRGALRTLRERTAALFVEVEFCEIYKGQKLFSDVESFLRGKGFSFFGFHSTHERSRKLLDKKTYIGRERLLHADAVFFRDPLDPGQPRASARNWHVVFVCALLCGYFDFALELVHCALAGHVGEDDCRKLAQLIRKLAHHEPSSAKDDAVALADEVRSRPERANVSVGRFVDARRAICNFEDVIDDKSPA